MSQTWIIKSDAPVTNQNGFEFHANFTTNSRKFVTLLGKKTTGIAPNNIDVYTYLSLSYMTSDGNSLEVASPTIVKINDRVVHNPWSFLAESYRKLEFDTAPTGDLLTWLQANTDLQKEVAPGIQYQDIHLEDKELWNQLQTAWEQGDYTAALNVLKNASLTDKQLNAATINALTTELLSLQAQSDPSFKTGQIVVASEPPSDLAVGKVYFRLIGPVTDYNEQNAYYIEINQKTSIGYDVLNSATQADNVTLTENTTAKFGFVGVTYTLDKALYDVESLLQIITSS